MIVIEKDLALFVSLEGIKTSLFASVLRYGGSQTGKIKQHVFIITTMIGDGANHDHVSINIAQINNLIAWPYSEQQ